MLATQLGADLHPELRPLGLLRSDTEDVLDLVGVDPDDEVACLVADLGAVADLHH